ncbi:MAG: hypothetical protein WC836_01675 [Desulfobacula sp.]|jgi:hypothetical protein
MTRKKQISALDIAEELNTGKATIKFILRRFKKWLPCELINGAPFYLQESTKTIIKILEHLDAGLLPKEIDGYLETLPDIDANHTFNPSINLLQNEEIRLNKEGVILLKSFFGELTEQQKRIAVAHEKRATAEERKAIAIEKRAEAEEKKAEAMNNIANALQEINRFRNGGIEPAVQEIAHHAAKILIMDETEPSYPDIKKDDIDNGSKSSHIFEKMDSEMSNLLDEEDLIENFSQIDKQKESFDTETEDPLSCLTDIFKIDDLSIVTDNGDQDDKNNSVELNNLSALLKNDLETLETELDDLSALLDKNGSIVTEPLDDLSLLIDEYNTIKKATQKTILLDSNESMDDLSKLISPDDELMDDLSSLIDMPAEKKIQNNVMDDLSKLIDPSDTVNPLIKEEVDLKKGRTIKLDISPNDDLEKYKAAIMKIILELKTEGLSAEETTLLLNKNMIRTLSGKPEWSQRAISQIYKFMTSVK